MHPYVPAVFVWFGWHISGFDFVQEKAPFFEEVFSCTCLQLAPFERRPPLETILTHHHNPGPSRHTGDTCRNGAILDSDKINNCVCPSHQYASTALSWDIATGWTGSCEGMWT